MNLLIPNTPEDEINHLTAAIRESLVVRKKSRVCLDWLRNPKGCTVKNCKFNHYKDDEVCRMWKQGLCPYSKQTCKFIHADSLKSTNVSSLNANNECVICLAKEKTHAFVFCGHKCVCETCGPSLKECPVCLRKHKYLIRIYD